MRLSITNHDIDRSSVPKGTKILGQAKHKWQLEALELFKNKQWCALVCPCGAGKSTAQVGAAIQDVVASRQRRLQLFVVPQTHIADGFFPSNGEPIFMNIKGRAFKVTMKPGHHFCDDPSVSRLRAFLLTDRRDLSDCRGDHLSGLFGITSYHALVAVWESLTESERVVAIRNLHLRLDESHHVVAQDEFNKIGSICLFMMERGGRTSRITLSTATDFRGDKKDIFAPKLRDKFTFYNLDWLRHWKTLGIRNLGIEIGEFEDDPIAQVVKNIAQEKSQSHYVVIPPRNVGWRANFDDDSYGLDNLITALKAEWPRCRILDLVTQPTQDMNKAALLREPKVAGRPNFDVVITCMLGREGTDWCPCSRLHVTYPEGSLTLAVQTLGRMLRRFERKRDAIARYYYPTFESKGDKRHNLLDDRKNALLLMTQCEEMFYPIIFPMLPKEPATAIQPSQTHNMGTLETILGSSAYIELKKEFLGTVIENGIMGMKNAAELNIIIDTLLDDYDVPAEFKEEGRATLQIIFGRCTKKGFRDVSVAFVRENGFEALYETFTDDDSSLLCFQHNLSKMRRLRGIVEDNWEKMYAQAKENIKSVSDWNKYPALKRWLLTQAK
jgi:hypothetical protein